MNTNLENTAERLAAPTLSLEDKTGTHVRTGTLDDEVTLTGDTVHDDLDTIFDFDERPTSPAPPNCEPIEIGPDEFEEDPATELCEMDFDEEEPEEDIEELPDFDDYVGRNNALPPPPMDEEEYIQDLQKRLPSLDVDPDGSDLPT